MTRYRIFYRRASNSMDSMREIESTSILAAIAWMLENVNVTVHEIKVVEEVRE